MKIALAEIKKAIPNRKAGYEEEIMKCGSVEGDHIALSWNDFSRIKKHYALAGQEINQTQNELEDEHKKDSPSIGEMAQTAASSLSRWMRSGVKVVDEPTLESRLNECKACEFWNSKGFRGPGRCMKCGCSTWAKLRMATEKCPIGKW